MTNSSTFFSVLGSASGIFAAPSGELLERAAARAPQLWRELCSQEQSSWTSRTQLNCFGKILLGCVLSFSLKGDYTGSDHVQSFGNAAPDCYCCFSPSILQRGQLLLLLFLDHGTLCHPVSTLFPSFARTLCLTSATRSLHICAYSHFILCNIPTPFPSRLSSSPLMKKTSRQQSN